MSSMHFMLSDVRPANVYLPLTQGRQDARVTIDALHKHYVKKMSRHGLPRDYEILVPVPMLDHVVRGDPRFRPKRDNNAPTPDKGAAAVTTLAAAPHPAPGTTGGAPMNNEDPEDYAYLLKRGTPGDDLRGLVHRNLMLTWTGRLVRVPPLSKKLH
ncbi:MAG TPA: hypothetical protein DCY07_03250 [Rhodospirillaceae bacterium]|nr:hypothetical protein [Rhodospirillaceae bacterium]